MAIKNQSRVVTSSALYFLLCGLGYVFIFGPMLVYFLINESAKGRLFFSEALIAFGMSCVANLAFATLSWLLIEPMRKRRRLNGSVAQKK